MDSIPPIVRSVVEAHLKALLYWFGDEIYRRLWRRAQDHFLGSPARSAGLCAVGGGLR